MEIAFIVAWVTIPAITTWLLLRDHRQRMIQEMQQMQTVERKLAA